MCVCAGVVEDRGAVIRLGERVFRRCGVEVNGRSIGRCGGVTRCWRRRCLDCGRAASLVWSRGCGCWRCGIVAFWGWMSLVVHRKRASLLLGSAWLCRIFTCSPRQKIRTNLTPLQKQNQESRKEKKKPEDRIHSSVANDPESEGSFGRVQPGSKSVQSSGRPILAVGSSSERLGLQQRWGTFHPAPPPRPCAHAGKAMAASPTWLLAVAGSGGQSGGHRGPGMLSQLAIRDKRCTPRRHCSFSEKLSVGMRD